MSDGRRPLDPEGRDSSLFACRYRRGDTEEDVTVILSGTAMASPEGLETIIAEMVWSRGASALIASLRKGRMPQSITAFSDGRIIEAP
jgi:hypothetical protein